MVSDSSEATRRYESPVRRARAQRTRAHVVATAGRLFAERGYASTSMRQIAAEAAVSLETVTQAGRKADLLIAAFRDTFTGEVDSTDLSGLVGEVPSDGAGPSQLIPTAVERLAGGLRRSLGIWRAFSVAAAADSAVAAVRVELARARRREITAWLARFESAGQLPERDIAARELLADALGLLASHESYEHLTEVCGWAHEQYVEWTAAAIQRQLSS